MYALSHKRYRFDERGAGIFIERKIVSMHHRPRPAFLFIVGRNANSAAGPVEAALPSVRAFAGAITALERLVLVGSSPAASCGRGTC